MRINNKWENQVSFKIVDMYILKIIILCKKTYILSNKIKRENRNHNCEYWTIIYVINHITKYGFTQNSQLVSFPTKTNKKYT